MSDDNILNLIYAKVEKIGEDVGELKISGVRQEEIQNKHEDTLQVHIKRSDMLEKMYNHLDEDKIQPLQNDMAKLHGVGKFIGFLGVIATIILTILKLIGK